MDEPKQGKPLAYEAHITFSGGHEEKLREYAIASQYWKFSQMLGDPVLGEGDYCYLTAHGPNKDILILEMGRTVGNLAMFDIKVKRVKIELDVFDARFGVENYPDDASE